LALSADQLLLACVSGGTVRVFSLPALLSHQSDLPAHTLQLGQTLLQFCWSPDAADSTQFLALTSGRVLLHGSLTSGSASLAEHVDCACWSPSGQHVAYCSSSKLVVTGVDWKDTAFKVDLKTPVKARSKQQWLVESLREPVAPAGASLYNPHHSAWNDTGVMP
jgi:WD40 repeat protein